MPAKTVAELLRAADLIEAEDRANQNKTEVKGENEAMVS
jgi:hypothetical protein